MDLPRTTAVRRAQAYRSPSLLVAHGVAVLAASALLVMLAHTTFLGNDSAISYTHTWYVADAIYEHAELPLHVRQLDNGRAYAFPYAFVPWLPAALLYPLLGDRGVTLAMVAGALLMVAGMWRWRPVMRRPDLFALFLLNPLLWDGIFNFQLATIWSFAGFFVAAASYERRRWFFTTAGFALSFCAHPMMGTAAALLYALWTLGRDRRVPFALLATISLGAVIASPIFVFMAATPVVHDVSPLRLGASVLQNMRRLSIVALPFALSGLAPYIRRWWAALLLIAGAGTAAFLIAVPPVGLWRQSAPRFAGYLAAHPIDRGASYRIVTSNPGEDGITQLVKAGATLSHELYSESLHQQVFPSLLGYQCLLATTGTTHVLIHGDAPASIRASELERLEQMVTLGEANLQYEGPDGTRAYRVFAPQSAGRPTPGDCDL